MGKNETAAIARIARAFYGAEQAARVQAQAEATMSDTAKAFIGVNEARYATHGTKEHRAYQTALRHCGADQSRTEGPLMEYQGRPISFEWHGTPQLYVAYFEQEYDGATDSHHPIGFGRTEDEAVADLIEKDAD